MILIADGGSTKVDWVLINQQQKTKIRTEGINPSVITQEEIIFKVKKSTSLISVKNKVSKIYFYGAGCGSKKAIDNLKTSLNIIFTKATVKVHEDTLGAAYASSGNKPAIVAILGTGSNSCYFDGKKITQNHVSLGYTIMDEASGNYFGKILLRDYFYNNMPNSLKKPFNNKYNTSVDYIKNQLYKSPNPNTYLASLSKFMFEYKEEEYIQNIITKGFQEFFDNQINSYQKNQDLSLYFIGSIAFYFKDILIKVATKNNTSITEIIQHPIDRLVEFHQKR